MLRPRNFKVCFRGAHRPRASRDVSAEDRSQEIISGGQNIVATFDGEASGQSYPVTLALIVKKTDTLYIGACKYAVFQIEKSEGRGERAPVFINNDYYAANLKQIIAKEYKERGGTTTWVKYDKIYSAAR